MSNPHNSRNTARPVREEPLQDVAYAYDGTPEGLLTAVFQAYANREDPQDIAPGNTLQPRLGQTVRTIETDMQLAMRVRKGIQRTCGQTAFEAVLHAALSDDPNTGAIVYRFVRYAMSRRQPHDCARCPKQHRCASIPNCTAASARRSSVLDDLANPAVGALLKLDRAVMNERHRMLQFLRFEHLENGGWFARCSPNASVVPLVMDWFAGRFNTQPFAVLDERHALAGVYEGRGWRLVRTEGADLPAHAPDEELMQAAWKRFYDATAVEARYNPELRRQFMPERFWKDLTEMREGAPGEGLAR